MTSSSISQGQHTY